MQLQNRSSTVVILLIILAGLGMALAGGQDGAILAGIPVFALCVVLTFLIQWLVFIFSYIYRTEKYFDLTGSITYISITLLALSLSPDVDLRSILLAMQIVVWAARLGIFLFSRVMKAGKDGRFDTLKTSFIRFLVTWSLQGLWITFTAAAAWSAITSTNRKPIGPFAVLGLLLWVTGFTFEVVADAQKNIFRKNPDNKGQFIQTGLWALSRHPNYFGEIVLWIGTAIMAMPVLQGWQWITMISPLFVAILLTKISGVPLLEKRGEAKWGGQEAYEAYKARTPVLIPRLSK